MAKFNTKKFSLVEMTSNQDGKTSASGTMGSILVAIGGFTFLMAAISYVVLRLSAEEILVQSIALCYAGALLLGFRKGKEGGVPEQPEEPEKPSEEPKE